VCEPENRRNKQEEKEKKAKRIRTGRGMVSKNTRIRQSVSVINQG